MHISRVSLSNQQTAVRYRLISSHMLLLLQFLQYAEAWETKPYIFPFYYIFEICGPL